MSQVFVDKLPRTASQCIRCECGFEIPMSHNHRELGRTIEQHALEHKMKEGDPDKAEAIFEQIQDHLIMQVYDKATEAQNEPNSVQ